MKLLYAASMVAALGVLAPVERAQAQDAAAQALYNDATAAMDKADYATACPKLEEVVRLVPDGVGARLTLGECYEKAGKLASAWAAYGGAETTANRIGQAPRAEKARKAAEALKPQLATLTIEVSPAVAAIPGLVVERDGVAVGPAAWGTAIPIDKGSHSVSARALGKASWSEPADAAADGATVHITVPALADASPTGASGSSGATGSGAIMIATPPPPPPHKPTSPLVYIGFITAGAGIIVGTATGIVTITKGHECKTGCTQETLDHAHVTAAISDVAFGVAAAGAIIGIIGLALPVKSDGKRHAELRLGADGASFTGRF